MKKFTIIFTLLLALCSCTTETRRAEMRVRLQALNELNRADSVLTAAHRDEAHELATKVIGEHFDKLTFVAEFLIRYEEMDDEQFRKAMEESDPSYEGIYALAEERRKISEKENEEKARIDEEERKKREEELMKDENYRNSVKDVNLENNGGYDGGHSTGAPQDKDGENGANAENDDRGGQNGEKR